MKPIPGDRVEVVFSDGHVHCRGVLVARDGNDCFVHCDGYPIRFPPANKPDQNWAPEWTSTWRDDQVRCEMTSANHLEKALFSLRKPNFGWFNRDSRKAQHEITEQAIFAMVRHMQVKPVNVADQIKEVTDDGIRRGDRINITVLEGGGKGVYPGTFVAEYKGFRHVIYSNGYPRGSRVGYPSAQITAA